MLFVVYLYAMTVCCGQSTNCCFSKLVIAMKMEIWVDITVIISLCESYKIKTTCIKGESNPRRVDGNDPGYHYPINAIHNAPVYNLHRAQYSSHCH